MSVLAGLPRPLRLEVERAAAAWEAARGTERLYGRDATLWTGGDEGRWLGWLDAPQRWLARVGELDALAKEARHEGFRDVLVLGMGGSSLAPEVLARTQSPAAGAPRLHVLDSTDPGAVGAAAAGIDPARTLVVVASKSGSTLEPSLLMDFFLARVREAVGEDEAPHRFLAITDPGSALERLAESERFRRVVHGEPTIGGRFSALSPFGLVPAALAGLDAERLLAAAAALAAHCRAERALDNPGVALGLAIGTAAKLGRDKLTFVLADRHAPLGAWLEQLVAESTGKHGVVVLPVDGEPLASPDAYGDDRLFVAVRHAADGLDEPLAALVAAGQPLVEIAVAEAADLGAEFYRWEIATAVAGALLGVHPFDQPDVEAAKGAARKLTSEVERSGALPAEKPLHAESGLALFADEANSRLLAARSGPRRSLAGILAAHLDRLDLRDYFALLAYLPMIERTREQLMDLRERVRDARRVATTVGFGPRYLHSTGQAHKGGPNTGVFLMITADPQTDLAIPGHRLSFGQVEAAQARGDFAVLAERGRRALRVHITGDVADGLATLDAAVDAALSR